MGDEDTEERFYEFVGENVQIIQLQPNDGIWLKKRKTARSDRDEQQAWQQYIHHHNL